MNRKRQQSLDIGRALSSILPAALVFGGAFLFTPPSGSEEGEAGLLAFAFDLLFLVAHAPTAAPGSSSQSGQNHSPSGTASRGGFRHFRCHGLSHLLFKVRIQH